MGVDLPGCREVAPVALWDTYLWIALGSALGGVARYASTVWITEYFGPTFPWGTLAVNVVGSFLIGIVATLTAPDGRIFVPGAARDFAMIGLFGGFTTFSSFSLQTLALARDGEWLGAGVNVMLSVLLCLVAVWAGHSAALVLNR